MSLLSKHFNLFLNLFSLQPELETRTWLVEISFLFENFSKSLQILRNSVTRPISLSILILLLVIFVVKLWKLETIVKHHIILIVIWKLNITISKQFPLILIVFFSKVFFHFLSIIILFVCYRFKTFLQNLMKFITCLKIFRDIVF